MYIHMAGKVGLFVCGAEIEPKQNSRGWYFQDGTEKKKGLIWCFVVDIVERFGR